MTVYCQKCGLWMTNGFCLHGSVVTPEEVVMREAAKRVQKGKRST